MSVDINWETFTSGPDGQALAEKIRSFIHDKFQEVPLPRFIRSVKVESFDFGTVCPEIVIKDLCDPFTDFYEEDEDGDFSDSDNGLPRVSSDNGAIGSQTQDQHADLSHDFHGAISRDHSLRIPTDTDSGLPTLRSPINFGERGDQLPRSGTPGIPGGTSNLSYYYMSLGGLSGSQTPLAAVAGGTQLPSGWQDSPTSPRELEPSPPDTARIVAQQRQHGHNSNRQSQIEGEADSTSPSRPSTANTPPSATSNLTHQNPPTPSRSDSNAPIPLQQSQSHPHQHPHTDIPAPSTVPQLPRMREQKTEDLQVVSRLKYSGDITLSLTAEILLDYPMPSFVGLPLKLNITGMSFDGVAVLAYIRRRAHFCFLSPEDADALLGPEDEDVHEEENESEENAASQHSSARRDGSHAGGSARRRSGGLLQEIHVESEIGRKENGKQVLKNVGKVERFVLQEVRRIFEDEFVFPSFWTFLI